MTFPNAPGVRTSLGNTDENLPLKRTNTDTEVPATKNNVSGDSKKDVSAASTTLSSSLARFHTLPITFEAITPLTATANIPKILANGFEFEICSGANTNFCRSPRHVGNVTAPTAQLADSLRASDWVRFVDA